MINLYAFVVSFGFLNLHIIQCAAISDKSLARQLAYLSEKLELLAEENDILKSRVDEVTKENLNIKARLLYMEDTYVKKSDGKYNTWNRKTKHTAQPYQDVHPLEDLEDELETQPDTEMVENVQPIQPIEGASKSNQRRLPIESDTAKVAFTAVLTKLLPLGPTQTVEYDKIITNIGNGYDSRHGHFTAPTRAVYLFACTLMNAKGGSVYTEIVKNGVAIARLFGESPEYNMGTQVSIVLLEKGDMVWVRHEQGHASETLHSTNFNTFSGTILFQM